MDLAARAALEQYPAPLRGPLTLLGNRGGFSGARLWKVGDCCLRAWPVQGPSPDRLRWIHQLMGAARDAGLHFVPAVLKTSQGNGSVELAGRQWDLTSWQPGRADFHALPSAGRLAAAGKALAASMPHGRISNRSTVLVRRSMRRLERLAEWQALLQSGWRPAFRSDDADPVLPWAARGWDALGTRLHRVPGALLTWMDRRLPLQPCLCDIWHDHVLFEGDAVTGLIDYGSVRMDHVAADLARLLGSLVGDDRGQWERGLAAYTEHRQLSAEEMALARVLDETGTLLGVANWLRWLYHEKRQYEDRVAVARRLAGLVERIECWVGCVAR